MKYFMFFLNLLVIRANAIDTAQIVYKIEGQCTKSNNAKYLLQVAEIFPATSMWKCFQKLTGHCVFDGILWYYIEPTYVILSWYNLTYLYLTI